MSELEKEPSELTYVSWDPGGGNKRSTGMVGWDQYAKEMSRGIFNPIELDMTLRLMEHIPTIKKFIIEAYIGFSQYNHRGSKFKTSQTIGQLKAFARRYNIEVIEQRSDIKRIASMWAGIPYRQGEHLRDDISAYLHGFYHLDKLGLIRPKVLDDKDN